MKPLSVVLALLFGASCGGKFGWDASAPSGEVEGALLAFTAQHATTLGLKTKGAITEDRSKCQGSASGWYDAASDTAFYYRADVEQFMSLVDGECPAAYDGDQNTGCEQATGIAAHEVCHAKLAPATAHNTSHWCCMVKLNVRPTYPPPVTPGGQWSVC